MGVTKWATQACTIPCSVDGRSYTLLACQSVCRACLDGCLGCQWPCCCINGIWCCPLMLRMPMRMGFPLHVMSTSSSLKTVAPVLVNTDIVPSSEVLPTPLINDIGKSWKVSACLALADNLWNGSWVTCWAWLVPPLATSTVYCDGCRMGRPAFTQSCLLRQLLLEPESYVIIRGSSCFLYIRTVLWEAKLICWMVLLIFLIIQLNAELMLYA